MILCAGYGTRLSILTQKIHKVLLPVLNCSILANTIRYLKKNGVIRMGINTYHLSSQIEEFIGDGCKFGIEIAINQEREILGTGGGVRGLEEFITDGDFIIYNGDIVTNIKLFDAVQFHMTRKPLMTLILHDYSRFNKFLLGPNGRIVDLEKRLGRSNDSASLLAFTGIAVANRRIFDFLPRDQYTDMKDVYFEIIKDSGQELLGFIVDNYYWRDVGSVNDYLALHEDILVNRNDILVDTEIPEGSVYAGRNVSISDKAVLKGFVSIGNNSTIEAAEVENCVIFNKTMVQADEHFKNCVIGPDFVLEGNG